MKWVRGWGYKFIDLLLFVTAALVIGEDSPLIVPLSLRLPKRGRLATQKQGSIPKSMQRLIARLYLYLARAGATFQVQHMALPGSLRR